MYYTECECGVGERGCYIHTELKYEVLKIYTKVIFAKYKLLIKIWKKNIRVQIRKKSDSGCQFKEAFRKKLCRK